MPNKHVGFGQEKVMRIVKLCQEYKALGYDLQAPRYTDALALLKEYTLFHLNADAKNKATREADRLLDETETIVSSIQWYDVDREDYFKDCDQPFDVFAKSRHSCRNLSGHVNQEALTKALELAMSAPSTCNRQSTRVHLIQSEEAKMNILKIQKGCRGFGELADQFIVITSDLSDWDSMHQRNAPYVDGGIFAMHLLYCLHFYHIGACTLNLYLTKKATKQFHTLLDIPQNEIPVVMMAIGIPPKDFDLARSPRRAAGEITKSH